MTEATPAKKDKKEAKDEKDSSSENDVQKPAAVSSPEPPPSAEAIAGEVCEPPSFPERVLYGHLIVGWSAHLLAACLPPRKLTLS